MAFVATSNLSIVWRLWPHDGRREILLEEGLRYFDLAYSPSGDALYFTGDKDGHYGLWRVGLGPGRTHGKASLFFSREAPVPRYPSISPDGKRVLYAAVTTRSNLASLRLSPDTHDPIGSPELLTHYANESRVEDYQRSGFGKAGDSVFHAVHNLAVARDGSIYVAETRTKRVVKLRPVTSRYSPRT